jgi:hypothetical protein
MNAQLERDSAVVPLAYPFAQTVGEQIHPDANGCQLIFFDLKEMETFVSGVLLSERATARVAGSASGQNGALSFAELVFGAPGLRIFSRGCLAKELLPHNHDHK